MHSPTAATARRVKAVPPPTADVVVIGAGLNQRTTSFGASIPADIPIIQIDATRSNIGRFFHADVSVVGDAALATEQLLSALAVRLPLDMALRSDENARWLANFKLADDFVPMNTPRRSSSGVSARPLPRVVMVPSGSTTSISKTWLLVTPYLRQCTPPEFSATLPPMLHTT